MAWIFIAYLCGLDLVIFGMGAEPFYVPDTGFEIDGYDQPVVNKKCNYSARKFGTRQCLYLGTPSVCSAMRLRTGRKGRQILQPDTVTMRPDFLPQRPSRRSTFPGGAKHDQIIRG
jgi:hypothetical protein